MGNFSEVPDCRGGEAGFIVLRTHVSKAVGSEACCAPTERSGDGGAIFAVKVQVDLRVGAIAVQGHNEATFESRYRSLLACSGGYPGTTCMR